MRQQLLFSFVILVFSISFLKGQALSGTYTIGGTEGNDFESFTEAVSALVEEGVNGHVQFLVETGDYNEQIKIDSISGTGPDAKVTFSSASEKKEDVRLRHLHFSWSTTVNYTIFIDGADYIEFSNMTIEALPENANSDDANRVIYVTGNSDYITFRNNDIRSFFTLGDYFEYNDCVVVGTDHNTSINNDHFIFENNIVRGGSTGLYFQGGSGAGNYEATNCYIHNNQFIDQSAGGMRVLISRNISILDNDITSHQNSKQSWKGIDINQSTGDVLVDKNRITALNNGSGIRISYINNTIEEGIKLVSNNSIIINSPNDFSNTFGIYSSANEALTIAHNSIYQDENNDNSILFYSNNNNVADSTFFVNNHLYQASKGLCFKYDSHFLDKSLQDYNNYFSPSGSVGLVGGNTLASLEDVQNIGYALNSSDYDPVFIRKDFLVATNNLVYDSGVPTIVGEDIFGNVRSTLNPDIGIYEGDQVTYDVGIESIDVENKVVCDQSDNLSVVIKNYSPEILNSVVLKVRNPLGAIMTYEWMGILNEGESVAFIIDDLVLENSDFLKVWTEMPNQKPDLFTINDTLAFEYLERMSGAYTVGDSSADFMDLDDAINKLVSNGICGPTTFNILPGIYNSQVYIPEINGSSLDNEITIQSAALDSSLVIFESQSEDENYIFYVDGASNLHLKHMTLRDNSDNGLSNLIKVSGNSSNCSFSDLAFSSVHSNGSSSNPGPVSLFWVEQNYFKNIRVENCYFGESKFQIYLEGNYLISSEDNVEIRNNTFGGMATGSILIEDLQHAEISGNTFTGQRNGNAIEIDECSGGIQISNNKLSLEEGTGIRVVSTQPPLGMPLSIYNNFISTFDIPIKISSCSNARIVHNNLNALGSRPGFEISINSSFESLEFVNNIMSIVNPSQVYNFFGLIDEDTNLNFDHNAFYSPNGDEFFIKLNTEEVQLGIWQELYQNDQNSIITNPKYISTEDLHLFNTIQIDGKGLAGTGILLDIDGEIRNVISPDIGADEITIDSSLIKDLSLEGFTYPNLVNCNLDNSIEVLIKNNASTAVDSFTLTLRIFDKDFPPIHVAKTIEPGENISHQLMDFSFQPHTLYKIQIEVLAPDGQIDDYISNNTIEMDYYRILEAPIKKVTNNCGNFIDLSVIKHYETGILWSTGVTTNQIQNVIPGDYEVKLTTEDGCEVINMITIE